MAKKIPGQNWEEAPAGAPSDPRTLMDVLVSGKVSLVVGHENAGDKLDLDDIKILETVASLVDFCVKEKQFGFLVGTLMLGAMSLRDFSLYFLPAFTKKAKGTPDENLTLLQVINTFLQGHSINLDGDRLTGIAAMQGGFERIVLSEEMQKITINV